MPELIKLYIKNVLIGFAIAAAFVAMLLWFNVMNLWHLVTHSDAGILAVGIMWFAHGIVFAGVQFAWAVMSMAEENDSGPRRGTPVVDHFRPVRVKAEANARPDVTGRRR
ncbi:hypothetical protein [Falsiphaeobacter marinintestinus]|uniref:hypothetical protein n=1 Tax=Falsiphaeobacter marinintestinus TaxID=1492905 RepID=UPI0011B82494|nr:hypothetical protein [Phaeobacter marinintestinus]